MPDRGCNVSAPHASARNDSIVTKLARGSVDLLSAGAARLNMRRVECVRATDLPPHPLGAGRSPLDSQTSGCIINRQAPQQSAPLHRAHHGRGTDAPDATVATRTMKGAPWSPWR
jgi:hypothetical protein